MLNMYELFQNYFNGKNQAMYDVALAMDEGSFNSMFNSLAEDEQDALTEAFEEDGDDSISKFLICTKIACRYIDACSGHTTMDDEGVLHLTGDSSVIELPVSMSTYIEAIGNDVMTIKDALSAKDLGDEARLDIEEAYISLVRDPTIQFGMDERGAQ